MTFDKKYSFWCLPFYEKYYDITENMRFWLLTKLEIINYNEQNGHYRDRNVNFDSELHVYNINGVEHKSVTTLVEDCFEQFDADYWSRKKAPSLGMTPQEVKSMWKRKGDEARNLGKQMHEKI